MDNKRTHRWFAITRTPLWLLLVAALFAPFSAAVVSAHGHTQVGDYDVVIGFHNEPAYQSEPNGLDLFITNTKTNEKVNGLADGLKAEIIFGDSKKELKVSPQFGRDGAYTANVLPTEAGDYTWHVWGDIKGTPMDVKMTSSPKTFGAVEAKSTVAFPAAEPTAADLRSQVQQARLIGGVGAVLGLIGTVVGLLGWRANQAPRQQPAVVPQRTA